MSSMTADVVAISLRMKSPLSSLRTRPRRVMFPQKKTRWGNPQRVGELRNGGLEVDARAETEPPRRLQFADTVRAARGQTGHGALENRTPVEHVECVNRKRQS